MISEPSTLITDYLLAAFCASLGWRLRAVAHRTGQRAVRVWAIAFAATAVGSFLGGTYHGFQQILAPSVAAAVWTATTIAVGLAGCLLLTAILMARLRENTRRRWGAVVWAQFAVYAVWMLRHDAFVYVIVEYGAAMLCALGLLLRPTTRLRSASRWTTSGIGVSIAAAAVQQSGFDVHRHLNHNDLQHLVQMGAVWLLYQGGIRLQDA